MKNNLSKLEKERSVKDIDDKYSQRFIDLDPEGYFLITINRDDDELIVEHFSNNIDELGRATNPETGKPLNCTDDQKRIPSKVFRGKTAKELGIQITEGPGPYSISKLDHALYLGRELQKAEYCLINQTKYIQD